MKKRIAIAGASGTGKTALAEALAKHYRLPLCPVGSRTISRELGYDSPYDVDTIPGARAKFQRTLFQRKEEWEAEFDEFVTDRTVLDNLAYTLLHDPESLPDAQLDNYFEAMTRYTHVAFLPIASFQQLGDDPARKKSRSYHLAFECILETLLRRSKVFIAFSFEVTTKTSLYDRIESAKKVIDWSPF